MPGPIKTEEIVRGSSDAPVKKKLKILSKEGTSLFPLYINGKNPNSCGDNLQKEVIMEPKLCYIKEAYFKENSSFMKMLDTGNTDKQSKRTHLCVMIEKGRNKFYIPLRNNLGDDFRKFGRIGHAVPSANRENAGLDYRYTLIVNDESYIELQTKKKFRIHNTEKSRVIMRRYNGNLQYM